VTGDKKWIYFDNPKRKKSWMDPGQPSVEEKYSQVEDLALHLVGPEGCAITNPCVQMKLLQLIATNSNYAD